MEKLAQLQATLGRLSPEQAGQLARTVELDRALGKEALPSTAILDSLRPVLRVARPPRVPTLCRLVCNGLEEFLTDRWDEPRLHGLIPRRSIMPWWQAAIRVAGDEIAALEARLRAELRIAPTPSLEPLQNDAQAAAIRWCEAILAALDKPKPDPVLRRLISSFVAEDIAVIAEVLSVTRSLAQSVRSVMRVASLLGVAELGRLKDLPPDCVTQLKQQYLDFTEQHGTKARYLALAVLNRLDQPRQILRLARALSWKSDDTLVANTEFAAVGSRLIGEIERLARSIVALRNASRNTPPPAHTLRLIITHYLEEAEGMLSEIGLRRDSPWGGAILKTRNEIAEALDREFLDRYAQRALHILPLDRHGESNLIELPSAEAIEEAIDIARLLHQLMQRGQRHGFGQTARETIGALDEALEQRVLRLCAAAQKNPGQAAALEAQAEAGAEFCRALFDSARAEAIGRRVTAALRRAS
jgi:hypothetical protein